jgi:hypothetical protein
MTTGSGAETFGVVYALAESPVKEGVLWAGTDDGKVWVTTDGGRNWTDLTANLPAAVRGQWISRIEAGHLDAQVAYLAVDAHRTGNYAPLAGQARTLLRELPESLSFPMSNSVTCTEDVPYADTATGDLADRDPVGQRPRHVSPLGQRHALVQPVQVGIVPVLVLHHDGDVLQRCREVRRQRIEGRADVIVEAHRITSAMIAFCVCRRFSAWSHTSERGP